MIGRIMGLADLWKYCFENSLCRWARRTFWTSHTRQSAREWTPPHKLHLWTLICPFPCISLFWTVLDKNLPLGIDLLHLAQILYYAEFIWEARNYLLWKWSAPLFRRIDRSKICLCRPLCPRRSSSHILIWLHFRSVPRIGPGSGGSGRRDREPDHFWKSPRNI